MNRLHALDGTSQTDRLSNLNEERGFVPDERGLEKIVATAVEFAHLVQFRDLEGRLRGTWSGLLEADEAIVLALIAATDLQRYEREFSEFRMRLRRRLREYQRKPQPDDIPSYQLASQINDWYLMLSRQTPSFSGDLASTVRGFIQDLSGDLQRLLAFLAQFDDNDLRSQGTLAPIWFAQSDGAEDPEVPAPDERREDIADFMGRNFDRFFSTAAIIQRMAKAALPTSLESRNHDPAPALHLAFLELFENAQQELNRFTQKHRDFYYRDVLKTRPLDGKPDSTYLVFERNRAAESAVVKSGTNFLSPAAAHDELLRFSPGVDLVVTSAVVEQLRTLYFERNPYIAPNNELWNRNRLGFRQFTTAARADVHAPAAEAPGEQGAPNHSWPLLGAPKPGTPSASAEDAAIGFSIGSDVLFLREGERRIQVSLRIDYVDPWGPRDNPSYIFQEAEFGESGSSRAAELCRRIHDELGGQRLFEQPLDPRDGPGTSKPESRAQNLDGILKLPESAERLAQLVQWLNRTLQIGQLYEKIVEVEGSRRFEERLSLTKPLERLIRETDYRKSRNFQFHSLSEERRALIRRLNRTLLEMAFPAHCPKCVNLTNLLDLVGQSKSYEVEGDDQEVLRRSAFFKSFREMFTVELTGEGGWLPVVDYRPVSWVVDEDREIDRLTFDFTLGPEVEPIVCYQPSLHGPGYETTHPLVRFLINPQTRCYPYSFLRCVVVRGVEIEVEVRGARNLVLYNNLGRLSSDAPFMPFGPNPTVGSYLIAGNVEAAPKRLTDLSLSVEWGGLAGLSGGFAKHYEGYGKTYNSAGFVVDASVLSGGDWYPRVDTAQHSMGLFVSRKVATGGGGLDRISPYMTLSCRELMKYRRVRGGIFDQELFDYGPLARDGFFKLTLTGPEYGFGHSDYPRVLSKALAWNARIKKERLQRPLPNPPYNPTINRIELNYEAVGLVKFERVPGQREQAGQGQFFHVHPFGLFEASAEPGRNVLLVPEYDDSGNLFIGVTGDDCTGVQTLFFHLRDDCDPETAEAQPQPRWSYLVEESWQPLPRNAIIADTTRGFQRSGIVALNVPGDMTRSRHVMPEGLYWLKVSLDSEAHLICSAYGVRAQALQVTRRAADVDKSTKTPHIESHAIREASVTIAGIDNIVQPTESFAGRARESWELERVRISERLRHKNRGVLPRDYESLILERFPEIFKVKCFPNTVAEADPVNRERPGNVLIVVIPTPRDGPKIHLAPQANGLLLGRIKAFVGKVAPPGAKFSVRNPAYEKIQIRCTVKLNSAANAGYYANELDKALSDFLSPWTETGYRGRFGWRIKRYDVVQFMQGLSYVEFITDFSMLQVVNIADDNYRLLDTVRRCREHEGAIELDPEFPWSIAVPAPHHYLVVTDRSGTVEPRETGTGELEIGANYIVGGSLAHG